MFSYPVFDFSFRLSNILYIAICAFYIVDYVGAITCDIMFDDMFLFGLFACYLPCVGDHFAIFAVGFIAIVFGRFALVFGFCILMIFVIRVIIGSSSYEVVPD